MELNKYVGTLDVTVKQSFWTRLRMAFRLVFRRKVSIEFYFDELADALLRARQQAIDKEAQKN